MTDKNLVLANLNRLKRQTAEQLQTQTVKAVVLALGSNHQPKQHLAIACKDIAKLGQVKLSTAFQNPDFTATVAQPKPDYVNQCIYLSLNSSMTLTQLQRAFKQIENDCNRQRQAEKTAINQVTMDIDMLLVKLELDKNSLSKNNWIIIQERYPFKAHEMAGMRELIMNSL